MISSFFAFSWATTLVVDFICMDCPFPLQSTCEPCILLQGSTPIPPHESIKLYALRRRSVNERKYPSGHVDMSTQEYLEATRSLSWRGHSKDEYADAATWGPGLHGPAKQYSCARGEGAGASHRRLNQRAHRPVSPQDADGGRHR